MNLNQLDGLDDWNSEEAISNIKEFLKLLSKITFLDTKGIPDNPRWLFESRNWRNKVSDFTPFALTTSNTLFM